MRKRHKKQQQAQDNSSSDNNLELGPTASPNTSSLALLEDKAFRIDKADLEIGSELGRGAFGVVYKCQWRSTDCVVKFLNVNQSNEAAISAFLREVHNVKNLRNHTNICSIFGVCADPVGIVMEYVHGGSLLNCIANGKIVLTPQKVVKFAKDIASGMQHLHAENIIHLDLACRNLLVTFGENDNQTIKITDFGLSRIIESDSYKASSDAAFPVRWTAPETLILGIISRASDVWSFAITVWEMIERKIPYFNVPSGQIAEFVSSGKRLPRPTKVEIPDELWDLMQQCWNQFADQRPSFTEICKELKVIEMQFNSNGTYATRQKVANQTFFEYAPQQNNQSASQPDPEPSATSQEAYGNTLYTAQTPSNCNPLYQEESDAQGTYNATRPAEQTGKISQEVYGNQIK